jgi:hypothetical protein
MVGISISRCENLYIRADEQKQLLLVPLRGRRRPTSSAISKAFCLRGVVPHADDVKRSKRFHAVYLSLGI